MVDTRIASSAPLSTGGHLDRVYVDWASVIGGAIVAAAIFTTLTIFGSAVGLSLTSANTGSGISAKVAAVAIGLWAAWIAVSSFAAGGYIAGRLRHRIADASVHETEMRDGLHGVISWALAGILSGVILAFAVSGLPNATRADTAASALQGYEVNKLFRGERSADEGAHADAKAVLATVVAQKEIAVDDHAYLAQLVTSRTGIAPAAANTRVDEAVGTIKASLDQVRRSAVIAAFLAAVSLALGAAAAWWAAIAGSKHRDEGTLFSPFTKWG